MTLTNYLWVLMQVFTSNVKCSPQNSGTHGKCEGRYGEGCMILLLLYQKCQVVLWGGCSSVELVDVFSVLMVPSCCMWNLQELHPMEQCILSVSFDIVSIILETGPVSASTYISLYWFVFFCYNSTQNSNVEGKTISEFLCVAVVWNNLTGEVIYPY